MIALLHRRHAGADVDDNAGAFVTEDCGEQALRIGARQCEFVGMTDTGRFDLDQHFTGARTIEVDRCDLKRFAGAKCHGGAHIHGFLVVR